MNTKEQVRTADSYGIEAGGEAVADTLPWLALRVRPKWEKLAAEALRAKDCEVFLPSYQKRSRWSDRVKTIDLPLFPGYLFIRANLSGGASLVATPGVVGIWRCGARSAVSHPEEAEALRAAAASGQGAEPWPFLNEGQRVRILCGSMIGVEGVLVQTKNNYRVVLSVEALCRSIAVEVDRSWIEPADGTVRAQRIC